MATPRARAGHLGTQLEATSSTRHMDIQKVQADPLGSALAVNLSIQRTAILTVRAALPGFAFETADSTPHMDIRKVQVARHGLLCANNI